MVTFTITRLYSCCMIIYDRVSINAQIIVVLTLDISFMLPSEEDLQSSGGINFTTEQSQIYIPYAAIQHQKETEGVSVAIATH